jgi:hypothetical protein
VSYGDKWCVDYVKRDAIRAVAAVFCNLVTDEADKFRSADALELAISDARTCCIHRSATGLVRGREVGLR